MREKLKTENGRAIYKQRKMIVEPVFGQVKEVRGFRRFSFRGLQKNEAEWSLICLTHNLLKLFRRGAGWQPSSAGPLLRRFWPSAGSLWTRNSLFQRATFAVKVVGGYVPNRQPQHIAV